MKYVSFAVMTCVLFISGCALDRYQAATPHFTRPAETPKQGDVIVLLEPVFPGKLFSEIVCDNNIGVMWNPGEVQQIGFTQHYASTFLKSGPQMAMLAALPANLRIGMSASGGVEPLNIDSRILVPFGRFIKDNSVEAVAPHGLVCEDDECARRAMQQRPAARLVSVRFTKFRVAEQKRNMLMLEVEGVATVTRSGAAAISVPIHNMIERSITSEGMWHSDFLKAMNKIANESSSAVAAQIYSAGI
jgi:hypothetical protein